MESKIRLEDNAIMMTQNSRAAIRLPLQFLFTSDIVLPWAVKILFCYHYNATLCLQKPNNATHYQYRLV